MKYSTAQARRLPNFSNFKVIEPIYLTSRTAVYRAVENESGQFIVIKVLNKEYPSSADIAQFQYQYSIAKNLEIPGVVRPIRLQAVGNTHALVMEDCGSISLEEYIQQRSLSLEEFFEIGLQLADILQGLYQHRVVHKDMKPANLLIHPDSKQVKLIDFSIATLLPKEIQDSTSPSHLEGTLAYIAPEQTGRMNRGIDFRTDYYSLGVTFYQLLSNELPFQASDPLDLLHCHIAKQPIPIHQVNPEVPAMVSAITHKLMAKNAEDRYQSSLGLKHDLEICLKQWQDNGQISNFSLGRKDRCDRFLIPEKLFGREQEVQTLLEAFERITQGRSELVLIAGSSGIGKTAVINEVHKPITQKKGYFIQGKFDQFNRDIPFSAFLQAFRTLMGQLLREADEELAQWKSKILEAVGQNGQLLIQVIPELETIIGPQPKVEVLGGSGSLNRFNLVFSNFVRVFCAPNHPLIIFVDDLQWADSGSLNLLKLLISDLGTDYLLVLGAYRDNEVSAAHPLQLTLNEMGQQDSNFRTVTLGTLNASDLNQLVAASLLCTQDVAAPLAQLIYQKTRGNPFFSIQFLKGLHEDGYITFGDSGQWQYDLMQVKQLALTDDIVIWMIQRLAQLPTSTQTVLMQASCIGNRFELAVLAAICEQSQEDIATELWPVLNLGLVIPDSNSKQCLHHYDADTLNLTEVPLSYRFLHDKVQQAVYSLIPDGDKERTHYQIGQLLMNNLSAQQRKEKFFEIIHQLNFGLSLVDPLEQQTLARLNLEAGKKAKASTAYAAAIKYLLIARKILLSIGWGRNYDLLLETYEELVESFYLDTNISQFEKFFDEALASITSLLDRIKFYVIKMHCHIAQNRFQEAVEIGLEVLKQLDDNIDFPDQPTPLDFQRLLMETRENIGDRPIDELITLPQMSDPTRLASMEICMNMVPPAYYSCPHLIPFLSMRMINLSIIYGNSPGSALGYVTFGFINCGQLDNINDGYKWGQLALNTLEKYNAKQLKSMVLFACSNFIQHWREPLAKCNVRLQDAFKVGLETGDFVHSGYAAAWECHNSIYRGYSLDALEDCTENHRTTIAQIKQIPQLNLISIAQQTLYNLQGISEVPFLLIGSAYDEQTMLLRHQEVNDIVCLAAAYLAKLMLCYTFGEYEYAHLAATQLKKNIDGLFSTSYVVVLCFYDSLTTIARLSTVEECTQKEWLEDVKGNQSRMKFWADHCPSNYLHKFYLVDAEYEKALGNNVKALEQYDRAIATARENHFLNEEALANELAALFYFDWGKEKAAVGYLQAAYSCYFRWGAHGKTAQLMHDYPQILEPILQNKDSSLEYIDSFLTLSQSTLQDSTYPSLHRRDSVSEALDFKTVIQSAQILSSSLELNTLFAKLMQLMIQTSGAETCALVIPEITKDERDRAHHQKVNWYVQRLALDEVEEESSTAPEHASASLITPKKLEEDPDLPLSLIHYVKRSGEVVQVEDLKHPDINITDQYLLVNNPKSVLIHPIQHQDVLVGVLYLENRQTANVFHPLQRKVINFFCNQAGVALENAKLYQLQMDQAQTLSEQNRELILAKQEADAANQAKSTFLKHVSHELRTPLNGILGYTQILQRSKTISSKDIQGVQTIEDCSHQLLRLVNEVIDITQMDSQKLTLSPHEVHLSSSLKPLFEEYQAIAEAKGLQFLYQCSTEFPKWVIVDEDRLHQVLGHLIDNAIKYTREGRVKIHVKEVSKLESLTTLQFLIEDTGIGIEKEEVETLCDLFEQGRNHVNHSGGLGMGLAISQHIVQKMGSHLLLKSTPGEGSEFQFTIELPTIQKNSQALDSQETVLHNDTHSGITHISQVPEELVIPDTIVLESLLDFSQAGRLRQLKQHLEDMMESDQTLKNFAAPLLKLVSQYELEQIESVLSQYL